MSSLIGIRHRIRSTKNIAQITKAMEMVSASKMRRAQETALASRPFTEKLKSIMHRVAGGRADLSVASALTRVTDEHKVLVIVVSTTKGLCGSLNVNLTRGYLNFAYEHANIDISVVTLGDKAKWMLPNREVQLVAKFNTISEKPSFEETRAVARLAMDKFMSGEVDAVYVTHAKFISTLQNEIKVEKLLPIQPASAEETPAIPADYTIEPDPAELVRTLLPYQVEMSLYQIILEARAVEHSARMVAMKSASDNAHDLIETLTLDYNQARQSQVTSELLDVTTARLALE